MEKRVSCRAIIFKGEKMVSMYREKEGRIFYTFPGGGLEAGETEQECVVREVFEEFGLSIKPARKVYVYESERSIEHFFLCDWISGKVGSGQGEEFQPDRNNGVYVQTMIELAKIPNLPLMPPEIAAALVEDYKKNGKTLRKRVKKIYGTFKK